MAGLSLLATSESVALQCLWPSLVCARSPRPRHSLLAERAFLFALVWRLFTAVAFSLAGSRALSGAPSNFYTWIVTVAGSSLLATSGSLASQCLWPPCSNRPRLTASRVLKYARSLLHRHSPLAKGAFLFSRFRRLFATVCFFLAESRAFSRALSFFTG